MSSPTTDLQLPEGVLSQAVKDVVAERRRQIEAEGWTPEHDDTHTCGEMGAAAAAYALSRPYIRSVTSVRGISRNSIAQIWPWSPEWWKPTDRRRDLVKAGALILAEIERLDRIRPTPSCVEKQGISDRLMLGSARSRRDEGGV